MKAWEVFRTVLRFPLAVLTAIVLWPWQVLRALLYGGRKLLLSARAWVLLVLLVIAALVTYYILSDRYTPLTTDAYVQAYVIQVAPRVEGQVVNVYVQENQTSFDQLSTRLTALAGDGFDKPIFVRADGKAPYEVVAQVMAALSSSGFSKINLITDTGGPSSGAVKPPARPPAGR